jgi:hypothetical protein
MGLTIQQDLERVIDLPQLSYEREAVEHLDRFHRMHRKRLFDAQGEPVALLLKQAAGLLALEKQPGKDKIHGVIAPLLPGDGKTLLGALAPGHLEQLGRVAKAKPLLVVPASLRQKTLAEYVEYGKNWRIIPPYVVSYSLISRRPTLLDDGGYNVFIFDEAHKLKDLKSARTRRVLTALVERPEVVVVLMSGSFWGEGLHHSAHWLDAVLRENTPIPLNVHRRRSWAKVLDIRVPDHEVLWNLGDFEALRRAFSPEVHGRVGARTAFARRMATAPGIVASRPNPEDMVAASLILGLEDDLPLAPECHKAIAEVLESGERPDGEILLEPAHMWQCARNLSSGFYYRWIWPDDQVDLEWLDARRRWFKAARTELSGEHQKGYDTEGLIVARIKRGQAPEELAGLYARWMREKQRVCNGQDPPKEPVWLDRNFPRALIETASRFDAPAILWVESDAMQDALAQEAGVKVYRGLEPPQKPEAQVSVMSWRSHGEGRNFQGWSRCFIGEPPGGAPMWEQLLARTHRRGQRADEVIFGTPVHTHPLSKKLLEAVENAHALSVQDGVPQRLDFCDKIDLAEVLKKRK